MPLDTTRRSVCIAIMVVVVVAALMSGCARGEGDVPWQAQYHHPDEYGYGGSTEVIVRMCELRVIQREQSKAHIRTLLGEPDSEHIDKVSGRPASSYDEYGLFVLEYDEEDHVTDGAERAEEGAAASGAVMYHMP